MDDTPIGRAAQLAVEALGRAGEGLPRPEQTRVIVVANQKGGVGKTTTTVNLAASLALHGNRVLVIDLDPQGNASTALGIDHHSEVPSIYDVLVESKPMADVVQPVPDVEGLFCAPATIDLAGAEIELVSLVARESRLQRAIQSYEQPLDYILIDCPPSLGLLTVNALVAGVEVLIPIQCEYYALEGLGQLLRNVELVRGHLNPQLHVSTILLTMYDARTRLAAQVAQEVRTHFGKEVLRTNIPRSVRISEAPSYGQTVLTYDPGSTGALSYFEAAREIALRGASTADAVDARYEGPHGQQSSFGEQATFDQQPYEDPQAYQGQGQFEAQGQFQEQGRFEQDQGQEQGRQYDGSGQYDGSAPYGGARQYDTQQQYTDQQYSTASEGMQ